MAIDMDVERRGIIDMAEESVQSKKAHTRS